MSKKEQVNTLAEWIAYKKANEKKYGDKAWSKMGGNPLNSEVFKRCSPKLQKEIQDQEKYENARLSKVSNQGEDIKNSARHKANQFSSLAEAELLGVGEKFAKREAILKDLDLTEGLTEENATTRLFSYLLLKKFPSEPEIQGSFSKSSDEEVMPNGMTVGEAKRKARQVYTDTLTELKKDVESGLFFTGELKDRTKKLLAEKIKELRVNDKYNQLANQFINYEDKAFSNRWRNKNSIQSCIDEIKKDHPMDYVEKVRELIKSGKVSLGEKKQGNKERVKNYYDESIERVGKDIPYKTTEEQTNFLMEKVKLRGLQWGNSISDKERVEHTKHLAEAVCDLSDTLGIKPEDLSLGKELGVAVGARGNGKAQAHYEPKERVINITKNGAGALAHEYLHALDNLTAKKLDRPMYSKGACNEAGNWSSNVGRDELGQKANAFNRSLSKYQDRLVKHLQGKVGKSQFDYYINNQQEHFARIGERIVQRRLAKEGRKNTYLAGVSQDDPIYPTEAELDEIEPHWNTLFEAMKKGL